MEGGRGLVTAFDRQGDVHMAKKKWKKGLLSSGFPLEFETAKVLVKSGFVVQPDYCYERIEAGQTKDFSIDLKGDLYFPTSNPNRVTASLELLVECKYRAPNMTWVLLPDVNRPEHSVGEGYVIRPIDRFSFCKVSTNPIWEFEDNAPLCYKGTEIDLSDGNAYDAEIRRGISQLQYGLPRLISESISFQLLGCHPEDVTAFFVLPILVTTADLRVLKRGTTLGEVENTRILEEITRRVSFLTLVNSFGPDFAAHSKEQFRKLSDEVLGVDSNLLLIEERLRASGLVSHDIFLPTYLVNRLASGDIYRLREFCSKFIVCSFEALPRLLELVKQVIRSSLRKRKQF